MIRPRIDRAIHAQLDRRTALLRDVVRSGGKDCWSHLFSHGHRFPTVRSAVGECYLREPIAYHYEITQSGKRYLADLDEQAMRTGAMLWPTSTSIP